MEGTSRRLNASEMIDGLSGPEIMCDLERLGMVKIGRTKRYWAQTCKNRDSISWAERCGTQKVYGKGVQDPTDGQYHLRCQIDASVAVRRAAMIQMSVREEKIMAVHYVLEGVDVQVYMDDEDEMTFLENTTMIYNNNSHDSTTEVIGVSMEENDLPPMPSDVWIMDTGCGHDLVREALVEGYPTTGSYNGERQKKIVFATANGKVSSRHVVPMRCNILNTTVAPYALPETPSVLSIGLRCMEQGYSFHWRAGQLPVLVTPCGNVVPLEVERNVPVLRVGEDSAGMRGPTEYQVVPIAPVIEEVIGDGGAETGELGDGDPSPSS